jgi:hypothetical protein
MPTARKAERFIEKNSILKGFVTPDYSGLSISNIPHTVLEGFGAGHRDPLNPDFFDPSVMAGVKNIVLLCVDGMGYSRLRKTRFLRKMEGFPLTSVAPSTTATALSTLASGLTPQEHGIVGFRIFLRELGHVTNMLRFGPSMGLGSFADEGIDPEIFFPFRTIYQKLKSAGVKSYLVNKADFTESPLSQMIYRGGESVPYLNLPDMFIRARKMLEMPGKKFVYLYWDMVDTASHIYGPDTEEALGEIKLLDSQVSQFLDKLKPGTLFLLTADHGVIKAGKAEDLGKHRRFTENLDPPPTGESRFSFLHCKKGKRERIEEYFGNHFSRKAVLLDSGELLEKGLFGRGKPFPETVHRIGNFIIAPKGNYSFTYPYLDRRDAKGKHAGLSREEMLVPFLWKRV